MARLFRVVPHRSLCWDYKGWLVIRWRVGCLHATSRCGDAMARLLCVFSRRSLGWGHRVGLGLKVILTADAIEDGKSFDLATERS